MDTPYESQPDLDLITEIGLIQIGLNSSSWTGINTYNDSLGPAVCPFYCDYNGYQVIMY